MTQPAAASPSHLLLARHGQTEWNLQRRRQGQLDSPLTAQGLRDADTLAELARGYPVDVVVCSPLGRAHRTATIIGERLGVPVELLDDLHEVDHGRYAGLTDDEIDKVQPGWRTERARDLYRWRFPGGESYKDAHARARRALSCPVIAQASCPLVVTHEMVARMLMAVLENVPVHEALKRNLPHGTLLVFGHPLSSTTQVG